MIKDYVAAYTDRFGSAPSALTTQAYDSVGMLLSAIEVAGTTDTPAVRDALSSIEYNGITGNTQFTEIGDVEKDFVKVQVQDGKFVELD